MKENQPSQPHDQKNSIQNATINVEKDVNNSNLVIGGNIINILKPIYLLFVGNPDKKGSSTEIDRTKKRRARKEYRYKRKLLDILNDSWLKGVLSESIYANLRIPLDLEERRHLVYNPAVGFGKSSLSKRTGSSPETNISDLFNRLGEVRTLLILGEPGSGKTTILLELAESLAEDSKRHEDNPIPVVLSLSFWSLKPQPLKSWLIAEIEDKYKINKNIVREWIDGERLVLLLDGLDEVKETRRKRCLDEIEKFLQDHDLTDLVISSRMDAYKELSCKMRLSTAVYIRPLTSQKVEWLFNQVGEPLDALKRELKHRKEWREFATTPLIVNIMATNYDGLSVITLPAGETLAERQSTLFNNFIAKLLERKETKYQYTNNQTIRYLEWMANVMNIRLNRK